MQWINALKEFENTLFVFPWTEWEIYRFNWADLIKIVQIPNWTISDDRTIDQNTVRIFNNWLIFWTRQGIYQMNRLISNKWFTVHKYWKPSTNQWDEIVTMLFVSWQEDFYCWFTDWGVDYLDLTGNNLYQKTETIVETNLINLTNWRLQPQKVCGVMADWFTTFSIWEIDILYKTDKEIENGSAFISLWTIEPWNTDRIAYKLTGISRRTKYIAFQFNLWRTWTFTTSIKLKSINII